MLEPSIREFVTFALHPPCPRRKTTESVSARYKHTPNHLSRDRVTYQRERGVVVEMVADSSERHVSSLQRRLADPPRHRAVPAEPAPHTSTLFAQFLKFLQKLSNVATKVCCS